MFCFTLHPVIQHFMNNVFCLSLDC